MNKKINGELLKQKRFGVEIETCGLGKRPIVNLIAKYFSEKYGIEERSEYEGRVHSNYVAYDHKGRKWSAEDDGSLIGGNQAELVTPILTYDDIEDLQEIVRILRRHGAKSNASLGCGVHIHVDAQGHTAKSFRNLLNIVASHEKLIAKAIGFTTSRLNYTDFIDKQLLINVNKIKKINMDKLKKTHYRTLVHRDDDSSHHYSSSRYYFLNLHAIWNKGTTEFRCFEFHKNMHAGELKAYIQLCLAMSSYAQLVNYASYKDINMNNEKCAMKNWLVNMGLVGDEFKTCRKMLTKRLTGDSAYRNGRPQARVDTLDDLNLDTRPWILAETPQLQPSI